MAELNQQQVIDYIKGISVMELSQLVKALESELGVTQDLPNSAHQFSDAPLFVENGYDDRYEGIPGTSTRHWNSRAYHI